MDILKLIQSRKKKHQWFDDNGIHEDTIYWLTHDDYKVIEKQLKQK
jgi:hypothetical protein